MISCSLRIKQRIRLIHSKYLLSQWGFVYELSKNWVNYAWINGHTDVVSKDIDINVKESLGWTPIMKAWTNRHKKLLNRSKVLIWILGTFMDGLCCKSNYSVDSKKQNFTLFKNDKNQGSSRPKKMMNNFKASSRTSSRVPIVPKWQLWCLSVQCKNWPWWQDFHEIIS